MLVIFFLRFSPLRCYQYFLCSVPQLMQSSLIHDIIVQVSRCITSFLNSCYTCSKKTNTCLTNLGVNLSLLSRVMSSRLSRGTFNGGLLSTEAGTLARVVADGTITLAGYLGVSKVLNTTLVPSLFFCVCSIVATCFTYNSLY